mgnify:CR=1 FL=1
MQNMGDRIKKRREFMDISTGDLAAAIGVSSSFISQIERAKAFPSILTLKKIADALQTTVGELIGEHETLISKPLVRSKRRKFVKENDSGTRLYLLSHHDPKKEMDTFLVEFEKGADSEKIMTTTHPRQEFCYVLEGKFNVVLDTKKYVLEKDDGFYFTSDRFHLFTNISKVTGRLIWIVNH